MLKIGKILNDILTGEDNETVDAGRFWYSITMICLNVFTLMEILGSPTPFFAATTYATAASTITVAFFGALYIKRGTEPTKSKTEITPEDGDA